MEKESGGRWDRPVLHELLRSLRPGDEVLIVRLDRLSRSVRDTLTIQERIGEAGAGFRSLTEGIERDSQPSGQVADDNAGRIRRIRARHPASANS